MSTLVAALIYCRVSTEEQADVESLKALGRKAKKPERAGMSLPTQLQEGRRYVSFQPDWVIAGEYQDILSGSRSDRPGYQDLLAEAKRLRALGRRVVIVVAALDRLGRDIHERVRVWRELDPLGVEFHSCRDGGVVSEFTFNILASVAREEVRRLGERVTASRRHVRDGGWKVPGHAALGYTWRPSTGEEQRQGAPASVLVVDELAAPYVREAFERAAGGESIRSVCRWIAGLPDDVRDGRRMSFRAVQVMLAAPVYVARPEGGDDDVLARPVSRWEPLVRDETWRAVRERVQSHKRVPRQASGRYLLTGALRCGCGARMCGARTVGGRRRVGTGERTIWPVYRCEAHLSALDGGRAACASDYSAAILEHIVSERVEPLLAVASGDEALRAALRRVWKELERQHAPDPSVRSRIGQLERAAERARERLRRAGLLLVDGTLSKEDYQALRQRVERDLAGAEAEIERLRAEGPAAPTLPDLDTVLTMLGGWACAWRSAQVVEQREVISALVERVVPRKVSRGQYAVEITWTPLGKALQGVRQP